MFKNGLLISAIFILLAGLFFSNVNATYIESKPLDNYPNILKNPDGYTNINVHEAWDFLTDTSNGIQIPIDVRKFYEWIDDRIDTPVPENPRFYCLDLLTDPIMLEQFMTFYDGEEVIMYCWSGGRSASASQLLVNNGFNGTIYNMLGGVSAWTDALYPTLSGGITNITVEEGYELLTDTANGIQKPIDVRTLEEWITGYIETPYPENASLHPLSNLQDEEMLQEFLELHDGKELIMYCHSGVRSLLASQILIDNQFTGTVYNMLGGIVAWDIAGYPIKTSDPDLDATGSLSWNEVGPDSVVQTTILLENIGESGSYLDWSIESYPNWGIWSFSSSNGNELPTDETFTIYVNITAPDTTESEFTGEVKFVNMENTSDFTILPVYLKTPRNRIVFNFNMIRLFRLFPIPFPMIRYLLS